MVCAHLKEPKLCGGYATTPSCEWDIWCTGPRWYDCEIHYGLRCVECQHHFDVSCANWSSHFGDSVVYSYPCCIDMFKFCEEWRVASPLSAHPFCSLSTIPFFSLSFSSCTLPLCTESRTVPASLPPPMSSPMGTTRASLLKSSNYARDSLTLPRQTLRYVRTAKHL